MGADAKEGSGPRELLGVVSVVLVVGVAAEGVRVGVQAVAVTVGGLLSAGAGGEAVVGDLVLVGVEATVELGEGSTESIEETVAGIAVVEGPGGVAEEDVPETCLIPTWNKVRAPTFAASSSFLLLALL